MPEQFKTIKPPASLKDGDDWGSPGTKKMVDGRAMKYADVGQFGVNEQHDIRDAVIKGRKFAPQFDKEINREVKKMNFNHAGEHTMNDGLHSDTTMPGATNVIPIKKPENTWTPQAEGRLKSYKKCESYDTKGKRVVEMTS